MAEGLKPCPFCGADAHITWNAIVKVRDGYGVHEERGVCIYCENCPVEMRTTAKHLAIEMWNRRANDDKGAAGGTDYANTAGN